MHRFARNMSLFLRKNAQLLGIGHGLTRQI